MKIASIFAVVTGIFLAACAAENSQVVIFNTGKSASLKVVDNGGLTIYEKTLSDRKTGVKTCQYIAFVISAKSQSVPKKIALKFEASNGDLSLTVGQKRSAALHWNSLKLDGKEMLSDPKKGDNFVTNQFQAGKVAEKKLITLEGEFRGMTKKEQQTLRNSTQNKKSAWKNKSSKSDKSK